MEPWRAKLDAGDTEAAWDLFVERYRRLIFATIRKLARDHDDVLDVFARICESLRADDLARLRRYTDSAEQKAQFSTWLVTVVRNLTIDWLRQRDGRPRATIPITLTAIQGRIYEHISSGHTHVETYEIMRASSVSANAPAMSFGAFLNELSNTYQLLGSALRVVPRNSTTASLTSDVAIAAGDPLQDADTAERVSRALDRLSPDERLALQLFVVDEMPAAEVARSVGWRNAKAVYNRVSRMLSALREGFERQGIGRDDL